MILCLNLLLSTLSDLEFLIFSEWEKEMYKANQQGKYPSFLSALRRTFGVGYSLLGLVALMHVSLTPFDAHNYYC